jgi:hypothetical protein
VLVDGAPEASEIVLAELLLVIDDEVEAVKGPDGRYGYVLTGDGIKDGSVRLQHVTGELNDRRCKS